MKDRIDEEYHKRFNDFEEMPPDELWDKIQPRIQPEKKRKGLIIWWQMGIAASILVALTFGYFFLKKSQPIQAEKPAEIQSSVKIAENPTIRPKQELTPNATASSVHSKQTLLMKTVDKNRVYPQRLAVIQPTQKQLEAKINNQESYSQNVDNQSINVENSVTITNLSTTDTTYSQSASSSLIPTTISTTTLSMLSIKPIQLVAFSKSSPTITFDIYTQEEEVTEKPERTLAFIPPTEVFANISPMLNYYLISPNQKDNLLVNNFNASEDRLNFAAQIGMIYKLNKMLSTRHAMSYYRGKSKISYDIIGNEPTNITFLNDQSIKISQPKTENFEIRNSQYLELQSDLLIQTQPLHSLSIGGKFGLETKNVGKPIVQARLGYRVSNPISQKFALWIEPALSVSLTSQRSMRNLFDYRTTGFSINMGVSWLR